MESSALAQYLRSIAPGKILFQPNEGNAGDSIIAYATFQLLHKLGIEFRLFDPAGFQEKESTLLLGGGGNLTFYNHVRKILHKYHSKARRVILLPQTICGNEDLLSELGPNVDILCREKVSYEYVRAHARKSNVLLMEDVAFELDVQESLATDLSALRPALFTSRLFKGSLKNTARLLLSLSAGALHMQRRSNGAGEILNGFRKDREKSSIAIPADNIDVSARFAYGTQDEAVCHYTTATMLQFLNRFAEIRTNRLHVCISGALLGKKVQLHSNNYFKCKAVYEHSIAHRFPNVQWMG